MTAPRYRHNDTYAGWTQDAIRVIHEANERGAASVEFRHKDGTVLITWDREAS